MAFKLESINERAERDPSGFALECETVFNKRVGEAAKKISDRLKESRVVFLSGPSGSGKTTTAQKICGQLENYGIRARSISLDNYFLTIDPEKSPRTKDGEYDRESPYCLDLELLNRHTDILEHGGEIEIPYFNFTLQSRDSTRVETVKLGDGEMVIFEGIHALNDMITNGRPSAFRLYISARSNIDDGGELCFKGTWMRLMRRVVRDSLFRGTDAKNTLGMWANVRRGEKRNISPFKNRADFLFDSSMPYEVPVMKQFALKAFAEIPEGAERFDELRQIVPQLARFRDIPPETVPPDSILREFIGGGIYNY